jgi:hypothetical protein
MTLHCCLLFVYLLLVLSGYRFMYNCIETAMLVRRVLHRPDRAIRLYHGILTFDYVAITTFLLTLDVSRVVIIDSVFERVFGRSLETKVMSENDTPVQYEIEKADLTHVVVDDVVFFEILLLLLLLRLNSVVLEHIALFFVVYHFRVGC